MSEIAPPKVQRKVISVRGELIEFWVTAEDTGGALFVGEVTTFPMNGPPPHIHHREDELFYVVEGRFSFLSGSTTSEGGPGFFCHVPKGTLHTYQNIDTKPSRALVVLTPGGFEGFWLEVADPVTNLAGPSGPPSPETIARLFATASKYGLEYHRDVKIENFSKLKPKDG